MFTAKKKTGTTSAGMTVSGSRAHRPERPPRHREGVPEKASPASLHLEPFRRRHAASSSPTSASTSRRAPV